jgi:hypothetical protein
MQDVLYSTLIWMFEYEQVLLPPEILLIVNLHTRIFMSIHRHIFHLSHK